MNILFVNNFCVDLCFLRYREFPHSCTLVSMELKD